MQYIVNVLAAILSINIWIVLYGYWQLQEPLPPDLEGVELILSGYIHDLPELFPNVGMRLILDVTAAQQGTVKTNFTGHVLLTWYKNPKPLKAGEQWQLQAKLKATHGNANPGSFDYEQWLFRNNIKAIGTISNTTNNRRLNAAPLSIVSFIVPTLQSWKCRQGRSSFPKLAMVFLSEPWIYMINLISLMKQSC